MRRGSGGWFGPGVPHERLRWTRRGRRRMAQVTAEHAGLVRRDVRDSAPDDRLERLVEHQTTEHHGCARRRDPWWTSLAAALRREPEALRFYVTGAQVAATGPWLYAWVHLPTGRVVHAGTTTLDPRVRAWVHLTDADPERGRVAALARSREDLDELDAFEVCAVRLPDEADRPAARRVLLDALLASGRPSEDLAQRATGSGSAASSPSSAEPTGAAVQRSVDVLVREVLRSRWR